MYSFYEIKYRTYLASDVVETKINLLYYSRGPTSYEFVSLQEYLKDSLNIDSDNIISINLISDMCDVVICDDIIFAKYSQLINKKSSEEKTE